MFNDLLAANAWNIAGNVASVREMGFACLKEDLWAWYAEESRQGRHHTRVQKFLVSALGTDTARKCDLFGAETNSMLAFSEPLLRKKGHHLGARLAAHKVAGDTLRQMLLLIRKFKRRFPPDALADFCRCVQRHLWALKQLRIHERPKHHFAIEMAGRLGTHGAPALMECWADETANFQLKSLAAQSHRSIWHARLLSSWKGLSDHQNMVKRRRL